MIGIGIVSYLAYEVVIVLPQVTKWWWRFNKRYDAFLDGGFTGVAHGMKESPKNFQDPYIPPTIVFKGYRRDYLRRKDY